MSATTIAEAFVEVRPDTTKFGPDLTKAAKQAADQAGDKMHRALGDSFQKIGHTMNRYVTLPIVAGLGLATKAASDLEEQQNKTNVVFGDAAASVNKFAKNSARDFGLSKRAALEAAGTYGNLFRALGLTETASAKMSTKLVGLAADLASFNNANPEEVLLALKSGLTGETEPLKKFGINLNDARLKQEAMNLGLSNGKGVLDANAKAQAAYSLILKDTTLAQGDFARTSGGLANQGRILKAELEDVAAKLGTKLIPAATAAAKTFGSFLDVLSHMPGAAQDIVLVGAGLLATIGPIASITAKVINLNTTLSKGGLAAQAMGKAIKALGVAGGIAIGITAIAAAVTYLNRSTKPTEAELAKVQQRLLEIGTSGAPKATKEIGTFIRWIDSLPAKNRGEAFDEIDKGLAELVNNGNAVAAANALRAMAAAGGTTTDALLNQKGVLNDYKDALTKAETAQHSQAAAQKQAAVDAAASEGPLEKEAHAYDSLEEAVNNTKKAIDRYLGRTLSLDEASDAAIEATDALTTSIKENGKSFDLSKAKNADQRAAVLANRDALREVITTQEELVLAEQNSGKVANTAAAGRDALIAKLYEQARVASPEARAEILRYIESIKAVPNDKVTQMAIDDAEAKAKLTDLKAQLASIPGIVASVFGSNPSTANSLAQAAIRKNLARAEGGPVTKGQPYIVGEKRPELFVPNQSGTIIPNLKGLGGSGSTINVTLYGAAVSPYDVASEIAWAQKTAAR